MKRTLLNPGFEFIFALGIITMLMLPPLVMAQQPPKTEGKQLKIVIQNNDTTINGKNIKQLSKTEHARAVQDLAEIGQDMSFTSMGGGPGRFTFMRRGNGGDMSMMMRHGGDTPRIAFRVDTTAPPKAMAGTMRSRKGIAFKYDTANIVYYDPQFGRQEMAIPELDRQRSLQEYSKMYDIRSAAYKIRHGESRNSQSFSYANTNRDGFSTNVSYLVGDADRETAKRISGVEKPELTIDDLMLTPSFTTGKTNLSFTLTEKGNAEIQLKNSDGKILWTDKTIGSFTKSFDLPQNGMYYLQVKQGGKTGLRRIIKEQ